MFSPLELNSTFNIKEVTIDSTDSILLTGCGQDARQPVLGMRGMEVRERSGEQGYFEVRIVRNARDAYMYIGLTTGHLYLIRRDLAPRHWLDTQEVGYGWRQDGVIHINPTGFEDSGRV